MSGVLVPEQFIVSTLTSDATLMALISKVYEAPAPSTASDAYIVFQPMRFGNDVQVVNATTIMIDELFQVSVNKQTDDYNDLLAAYERLHLLLHKKDGTVSQGRVIQCYRERLLRMKDIVDGKPYRKLGGIYRLFVQ